ncbi:MAG: hypothetical protein H6Q59_2707, partial [Firmicutes bacterium]|nr:hypothetical protein [Bacillota bacterium]
MKIRMIKILSITLIAVTIMTGCTTATQRAQTSAASSDVTATDNIGTSGTQDTTDTADSTQSTSGTTTTLSSSEVVVDTEFTARDIEVGYEAASATSIVLDGSSIQVSGEGATAEGKVLTITKEGSYIVAGSLDDGQIIIDAGDKDKIQLILNGVSINCQSNAPIYIKNADKVFITLAEGTKNSLTDGSEYVQTDDNNVDGVIYSKADLTLNGSGTLSIQGSYKQGIVSKDDLIITGGTYEISAVKDALNGKDCVKIKDGSFTLNTTTGNGIQSKNSEDSTKGYVYISGGTINITNCKEGIEGTVIIIEDGTIVINATDDGLNAASASSSSTTTDTSQVISSMSTNTSSTNTSSTNTSGTNTSGTNTSSTDDIIIATATDDPIASSATVTSPDTGDDTTITRGPGGMKRGQAPAGEAPQGGFLPDDKGQGNFGGAGGGQFEVDENCYIRISGGTIIVNAQGDGIDSNGSLYVSGGTINVNGPTENNNGSLDYNGVAEITGGTVIVVGSAGMSQSFGETSTQCAILYNMDSAVAAGSTLTLADEDGNEVVSFTPNKQYQSIVISSPKLVQGENYTLTINN